MHASDWFLKQRTNSTIAVSSLPPLLIRWFSNAPKYRLVVRFTNKEIIVQIVYARLEGDHVLVAARSGELPRYGINHGLTNWTAGASLMIFCCC